MGKRTVPESVFFTCDGCKIEVESKHRPKYWTKLMHYRDAYDFQGNACAANNVELELCGTCTDIAITVLNEAFNRND